MIVFKNLKNKEYEDHIIDVLCYFLNQSVDNIPSISVIWDFHDEDFAGVRPSHDERFDFELFLITRSSIHSVLLDLCHEIVHIQQMIDNRLSLAEINSEKTIVWKDNEHSQAVFLKLDEQDELTIDEYNLLPWEIEANSKMREMITQFENQDVAEAA